MTNFGKTSWDAEVNKPKKSSKDLFMKLKEGDNQVRIITKPYEYAVHFYKAHEDDPGFGERILSSSYHGKDPIVDKGFKPKSRYLVGIIDRSTQSYKILDLSISAFKGIQEIVRDSDWGDPCQYDINIKVDKNGGPNGYYSVIPKSKKALSAAELEIKESIDLEDLKRRCTPPTPEQVEERMKEVDSKSPNLKLQNKSKSVSSSTATDDDDDDIDFPAVD